MESSGMGRDRMEMEQDPYITAGTGQLCWQESRPPPVVELSVDPLSQWEAGFGLSCPQCALQLIQTLLSFA